MPQRISDIAAALGAQAFGAVDLLVARPTEPAMAGPDDLALAMSPAYADALAASDAQSAIVWQGCDWQALGLRAAIEVPRARLAMAQLTQAFDETIHITAIHATAVIAPSATIGQDVSIGAFSVIGEGVTLGDGVIIGTHCSIETKAQIGAQSRLFDGVRIGRAVRIGARVILQPNVVVGADGFSFVTATPSNEERALGTMGRTPLEPPQDAVRHRIHSLGSVVIGDDVEVGANTTIDAGTIRATRVGNGTKIDNLVQVGHNVVLGEDCVLCAQAAVAGSAKIGDRVVMGGKSGIRDNVTVGADVVLGGGAIVLGHVAAGSFMMGYPAQDMPAHRAQIKGLRRLPQLLRDFAARE